MHLNSTWVSALTLCLLVGCATPRVAPLGNPMASRAQLPADVRLSRDAGHGNVIFVELQVGQGKFWPCVIDTGSTWTVFDKSLEPLLGKRIHTGTVWKWGVKQESGIYPAPKLYLGGVPLTTGRVVASDDFRKISDELGHTVMGLIGMDTLSHYCLQLDFAAGKLRFLDSDQTDKKSWGQPFPLADIGDGCLAVTKNLAGVSGPGSLIDTGCAYDGWLTPPVFKQWTNLAQPPAAGEMRRPTGILGGETYRHLALRGLGEASLTDGDRHMKFNGLGLSFLARRIVTFDFPNRTMYLKRPSVSSLIF